MKIHDAQRGMLPMGFWAHEFLSATNSRLKYLIARVSDDGIKPSYWQLVFSQSKANGCLYDAEDLPHGNWEWPKNTWFQDRIVQQQLKDPWDYQPALTTRFPYPRPNRKFVTLRTTGRIMCQESGRAANLAPGE